MSGEMKNLETEIRVFYSREDDEVSLDVVPLGVDDNQDILNNAGSAENSNQGFGRPTTQESSGQVMSSENLPGSPSVMMTLPSDEETFENFDDGLANYEKPTGHLECMLEVANALCVSPYRREEYERRPFCMEMLMMVCCAMFSFCACLKTLMEAKDELLFICLYGDLKRWTRFGYAFVRCVNRFLFTSLVFRNHEQISVMLLYCRKTVKLRNTASNKFSKMAIILGTISLLVTAANIIGGYQRFSEWSFMYGIRLRACRIAMTTLTWDYRSFYNRSELLADKFLNENYTIGAVVIAGMDFLLDYCYTLQGELIRDILLVASLVLLAKWSVFEKKISSHILVHPNTVGHKDVMDCVHDYMALRMATKHINSALAPVHKFVVIQNLLAYAYLFGDISEGNWTMGTVHTIVDVIKASVLLCVSIKLNWKNDTIKEWLCLMSTYENKHEVERVLQMSIHAALDRVNDAPVGFGSDHFLINETFLVGFFTTVSSMICFLVESEDRRRY